MDHGNETILNGIGASNGLGIGPAWVTVSKELEIPHLTVSNVDAEIARLHTALVATREQLCQLKISVTRSLSPSEGQIFDAHLLVLEDQAILSETVQHCKLNRCNIEYSYQQIAQHYITELSKLEDVYLRERAVDVRDVSRRLLTNLLQRQHANHYHNIATPCVVVTDDLTPSDAAMLPKDKVLAIVTDGGGRTSHAVIVAQSMGVPAVVCTHNATQRIQTGTQLLVDGSSGIVIIHPQTTTCAHYQKIAEDKKKIDRLHRDHMHLPSQTMDGRTVNVCVNLDGSEDLNTLQNQNIGVGLFRTELLFLKNKSLPDEETQFLAYKKIVESVAPQTVVIRTLDLGGDKCHGLASTTVETNPFLGMRALRICLAQPEIFKTQLRAILRAAHYGNVRVLFPMVGSVTELIRATELLKEAQSELQLAGNVFGKVDVGSMIEIPAAAVTADLLADHCSFFSIGTNDLIQYMLAVDRGNDRVAHLYEPNHPAILRMINAIVQKARAKNLDVCVCGEMAGDPVYVPLLVGLDVPTLSVNPHKFPEIKYIIRKIHYADAHTLAQTVLQASDPKTILSTLQNFYLKYVQ